MGTGQCPVKAYNRYLRELIHTGKATPSFVVSHELPLDRAPEGYQQFRAVVHRDSGRWAPDTVLAPGDGCRLTLGERGAGGERSIEPAAAEPVADLGRQLGLHPP